MVNMKSLVAAGGVLLWVLMAEAMSSDLSLMEKARSAFAKEDFAKAVELYSQVSPSSDFWLDSIEEKAWVATRQKNYEKALADLQSITSAYWTSQVGPESYLLSAFVSLKICNYKDVVKKINLFKKRMLPRVEALQGLRDQSVPSDFWERVPAVKEGQVSMVSLGQKAQNYPRYFYRDRQLLSFLQANDRAQVEKRLKQMAESDLSEIEVNLKKMKIIEVELIQKVLLADGLKRNKKANLDFSRIDRDKQLLFPVKDDEVWIDEVDHFQVRAENCPFSSRSSL